jgi:magnesium transporter
MLRTLVWEGGRQSDHGQAAGNGRFRELEDPSLISDFLATGTSLLWIDLTQPSHDELTLVADEFGLHPLAVEDATKHNQRPKIEEYDGFYFMVVFAIDAVDVTTAVTRAEPVRSLTLPSSWFTLHEVDLFVGERFLITVHREPLSFVEQALERWRHNSRAIHEGMGVLVYTLLDGIVDAYFPILDGIAERAQELEEALFAQDETSGETYDARRLFQLKRDLLQLRRIMAPERDALLVLARQEIPLFDRRVAVYFQDVYDHIARVTDAIDIYQDLLTNTLNSHLSLVSNTLNQVMKTLTSLTVILMVPTLIAGIYGMNFVFMPEVQWVYGYPLALVIMAAAAGALFIFFRRKGWI